MRTTKKIKTIEEIFPKGHLSIISHTHCQGVTTVTSSIAKFLSNQGILVLYVNLGIEDINVATPNNEDCSRKCSIIDMPGVSIIELEYVLNRKCPKFDTVIIDSADLMCLVNNVNILDRDDEQRAVWQCLEKIAKEHNIRIIGLQHNFPYFHYLNKAKNMICDIWLKWLKKHLKDDFHKNRTFLLHPKYFYHPPECNGEPILFVKYNSLKRKTIFHVSFGNNGQG